MTPGRLEQVSRRWFQLLLRLYPASFRDDMGDAVVDTYCRRSDHALANGGVLSLVRVWLAALTFVLRP